MTGHELLEALKLTGTGEAKLRAGEEELSRRPGLTAGELAATMDLQRKWPEGTVEKAKKLANGAPVKDFLGSPPPNVEEGKLQRLSEMLVEKAVGQFLERQAVAQADQTGNPAAHKITPGEAINNKKR